MPGIILVRMVTYYPIGSNYCGCLHDHDEICLKNCRIASKPSGNYKPTLLALKCLVCLLGKNKNFTAQNLFRSSRLCYHFIHGDECSIRAFKQLYLQIAKQIPRIDIYLVFGAKSLQWRHNERDGVSNHQLHDCLLNRLFMRRSKKSSKLRVTGLCVGDSPVTGELPSKRPSNPQNVSI